MTNLLFPLLSVPIYLIHMVLCFSPFSQIISKREKRHLYACYSLLMVFVTVLYYVMASRGALRFAYLKYSVFLLVFLMIAVHICVIRRKHFREYIFSAGLATLFNYISSSVAVFLTYRFFGWDSVAAFTCVEGIYLLLEIAFYYPLRRLIVDTVRPFLTFEQQSVFRSIWLIPCAMLFTCYFSLPGSRHMMYLSEVVSRLFLCIVAFSVCRAVAADYSRFQEEQILTRQVNLQKLYYTEMGQEMEEVRRQQHDLKHHLAAIQHYLDTGDKAALQEYCGELLARNEIQTPLPYSGNSAADGVIYHYMKQSQEHQIQFTYQGAISCPGIADTDLCVLLGNALDNALAGCLTVSKNRFIRMTAQSEKHLLSLLIQNSFDGTVTETRKGIQSRKQNHTGVGLNSMKAVCESCGGTIQHSWDKHTFTLCILLPLTRNDG